MKITDSVQATTMLKEVQNKQAHLFRSLFYWRQGWRGIHVVGLDIIEGGVIRILQF